MNEFNKTFTSYYLPLNSFLILYFCLLNLFSFSQDTIKVNKNSAKSIALDSVKKHENKNALKSKVKYNAKDSIVVNIKDEKIYLYGNAEVTYEKINVKASYIEVNFKDNVMYSSGLKDSTGKIIGKPTFSEDNETFTAENITYNFKTKKGIIRHINTKEGEGYLHGIKVKKMLDNITFINSGSYTTCSLNDPHYSIKFLKAKVIPDNKIVSGPTLLFIEGVPTPIGVPFGFFPINKGRKSGLIIPSYGESSNRGFYLENGGYYWGINDYVDMSLKGDIYTRGSWALKGESDYNWLYHYSGSLSLNLSENKLGDAGTPGSSDSHDFFIRWIHNQSDKARPNSRFSANVNFGSSKYNTFNPTTTADYLTNTFQSGISYSTSIANEFNLSLSASQNQNTQTHIVDITLPELTFTANRFYLFQNKERVGKPRWFENISVNYLMNARSEVSGIDSILFKQNLLKKINSGVSHNIPVSGSFKIAKYLTMTSTININDRWYFNSIRKDSLNKTTKIDTINNFNNEFDCSFSTNFSTRIYGMYQFKKGFIRAIRHVITPSLGFFYTPYFSNYFDTYYDPVAKKNVKYSIFQNGIYGSAPSYKSGSINFSLSNNLEMKVRSKKDTVTGLKKIILIEDFTIAESYDLAKDTMQWSRLSMSGHTKLLKNIDLKYSSIWDPYVSNMFGRMNKLEWDVNHQLFNMQSSQWALSLNWNLSSKTLGKSKPGTQIPKPETLNTKPGTQNIMMNPNGDGYVDFNVPWSLNIYYTFMWTSAFNKSSDNNEKTLVQTLAFNGDVNLTKKWKIGYTSGYDFQHHSFSYTSLNIYRDLHCWEMIFNWIPTGFRKSYNFTIRVKASVLKDLKLLKKTDWRDKQY